MKILQEIWKQNLRPRAVVGYGVKNFLPSPPNYVTRSPGVDKPISAFTSPPTQHNSFFRNYKSSFEVINALTRTAKMIVHEMMCLAQHL